MIRPVSSEKAVRIIDTENTLLFETDRSANKKKIKHEVEKTFDVKVDSVRTSIRNNRKFAYVRLAKENPAIDVATKIGMV